MKTLLIFFLFTYTIVLCQNSDFISLVPMPTARIAPKAIGYQNEIYVIGGNNNGKVEIFNPSTNTWRTGSEFEIGNCSWVGADSSNQKIYALIALGSEGNINCLLLAEYNPLNDTWNRVDSLKFNITSSSFTINKDKCYIVGGFTQTSSTTPVRNVDSLFIYDLIEKKWTKGLGLPDKRHAASVFSVDSLIYILNGVGNCFCTSDILRVNIYNVNTDQWTVSAGPSYHMAYMSGSLFNNRINYFRNSDASGISFNLSTKEWETNTLPRLQNLLHYCETVYNSKVYIFGGMITGGASSGQSSNSAYCYDPFYTTGIKSGDNKEDSFILEQNYPNPFNPATTINYLLPEDAKVNIAIYNFIGQKIATLADRTEGAGNYKLTWNAQNLSSGVYFCRFKIEGKKTFEKVQKLVLIK